MKKKRERKIFQNIKFLNKKNLIILLIVLIILGLVIIFLPKKINFEYRSNSEDYPYMEQEGDLPIVYSENYNFDFYGLENGHPFDSKKYAKVMEYLSNSEKINFNNSSVFAPYPISQKDIETVHTKEYLQSLNDPNTIASIIELSSIRYVPNKLTHEKLLVPMKYAAGGTVLASTLAMEKGWAINLGGGYHHAKTDNGSGFNVYSDIAIAIKKIKEKNPKTKILMVDLDAHQGNGYETIFANDKNVVIMDVYNHDNFPKDVEASKSIKYNFNAKTDITDAEYLQIIKNNLEKIIQNEKPDIIFYLAGTDIFDKDKLGKMKVSKSAIIQRDEQVFKIAKQENIPIVMLLAGGYSEESAYIIGESIENLLHKRIIN